MRKHKPFSPDKIKTWKQSKSNILAWNGELEKKNTKSKWKSPYCPSYLIPTQIVSCALGLTHLTSPHIFHSLYLPLLSLTSSYLTAFSSHLSHWPHQFSPSPWSPSVPSVCPCVAQNRQLHTLPCLLPWCATQRSRWVRTQLYYSNDMFSLQKGSLNSISSPLSRLQTQRNSTVIFL